MSLVRQIDFDTDWPMPVAAVPSGSAISAIIEAVFDRTFYLAQHADVAAAGIDPFEHFLQYGIVEGRSPHPAFDADFYLSQMPAECPSISPFLHYVHHGAYNRLDPHPLFDTAHYISGSEAGTLFGQLPLLHLLLSAGPRQSSPNALFDVSYYRRANQLGDAHPRHPLLHYIETGWREGSRTHPLFDPAYYVAQRPDVALAGIDPLAHYLRHGWQEAACTHELFNAEHYCKALAARGIRLDEKSAILHYATSSACTRPSPHASFDRCFYADRYCGSGQHGAGYDPFLHFLEYGMQSGLGLHLDGKGALPL